MSIPNQCTCGHADQDHKLGEKDNRNNPKERCKRCPCDTFEKAYPVSAPSMYDKYYGITPLLRKQLFNEFDKEEKTPVVPKKRVKVPPKVSCMSCIGFRTDLCLKCKGFGQLCSSCKEPENTCFCDIELYEVTQ